MKYIKSVMSNPHKDNIPMAVMFDTNFNHQLLYGFLKSDPVAFSHLPSQPMSAGFLRFGREGLRSHGFSSSLEVDANEEDGHFIMANLMEKGGEFIQMANGEVVILTKGYHDFNDIMNKNSGEVRGSFTVVKGDKPYLEIVPTIQDLLIPKSKENSFDKKKLLSLIYDVINGD